MMKIWNMKTLMSNRKWLSIVFIIGILSIQSFQMWSAPFWKVQPQSSLEITRTCSELFKPYINDVERIGIFYNSPDIGFKLDNKRVAPYVQLQYELAPQILDPRPSEILNQEWIIGYYEKDERVKKADLIGGNLGYSVVDICNNYVLYHRVK